MCASVYCPERGSTMSRAESSSLCASRLTAAILATMLTNVPFVQYNDGDVHQTCAFVTTLIVDLGVRGTLAFALVLVWMPLCHFMHKAS